MGSMTDRIRIQLATTIAVSVAYVLLASGTLRVWHGACAAGGCHGDSTVLETQGDDHKGSSEGSSHSPDCPICHQLTVASSAVPQATVAVQFSAAEQFLIRHSGELRACAQTALMAAAPRAPPSCL